MCACITHDMRQRTLPHMAMGSEEKRRDVLCFSIDLGSFGGIGVGETRPCII